MKGRNLLIVLLTLITISQLSFAQGQSQRFKMEGINRGNIILNKTFISETEIFPFDKNVNKIFGLAISGDITLTDETSDVKLILVDNNFKEYLIYEVNSLLEKTGTFSIDEICEETCVLNDVKVYSIKIVVVNASVTLKSLTYSRSIAQGLNVDLVKKAKKQDQNEDKINRINKSLKEKGLNWIAGPTEISELSYEEKKQLYGQSTFPAGFEYYAGGVISTSAEEVQLKSATATSQYIDNWDWRDRHGKNWISPVTNQGGCGSCWAFAATGATEAMVNVFFNQQLNLDLSEQNILSCSNGGDCGGGYPSSALSYIAGTGIVDEATFPYTATDASCSLKGSNPSELIKIGGRVDFGSTAYPKTEDDLKRMLIEMGPISGGIYSWSHALVLVGYKVVKEGDKFYYQDPNTKWSWITIAAGDPLIGKTVWIFKNSWGSSFGEAGYVYVESDISNIGWTHGIKTPITSMIKREVICEDRDGDGYFWWGLGSKPTTCNCPDTPDGNDADPTLGPLDKYGYCVKLNNPPLADFESNKTVITEGESITFSDLSSTYTTSWQWTFVGGNPATSNAKNPTVKYDVPGTYGVTLTAANANGSNTKTITNYTKVEKIIPVYCSSNGNATVEWIESVQLGATIATGSSGTTGYQDKTKSYTFSKNAGASQNIYLTPKFSGNSLGQYWKVWIDYNGDMDFEDQGELVFTSPLSTGLVSGSFIFPANLNITTRMRVSMKRGEIPSPCGTFLYGEVEDYTIKISSPTTLTPVANFSSNKTTVSEGGTVAFSDLSTNSPTSWAWTFAGGTPGTSTSKNPVITYSTSGTYAVTLTATNSGGSNTKSVTSYITVVKPVVAPVANFSADKTTVSEGGTVTFSDLSTNSPTSWAWTFAGGTPGTSTSKNPAISYSTSGTYAVTLTATNANGSNTKSVTSYITVVKPVVAPIANFSADRTTVTEGGTVTFSDLSTNSPTSWAWTFAGGTPYTSSSKNPAITYNTSGTYAVTLTATNASGSNTKTITNFITVEKNIADYCVPIGISSSTDFIQNVTIGNILNNTTAGIGYSVSNKTVSMVPGQIYSISLLPKISKNRNFWCIWIDLNNDGDFTDAGETLVNMSNKKGKALTTITIPSDATGSTRMRIAMRNSGAVSPCDGNYIGEVEDYPVTFGPAASPLEKSAFVENLPEILRGFRLFPNPVNQLLNIQIDSNEPGDYFTIYNMNGGKVVSKDITSSLTSVDFNAFSPGIYVIVVVNGGQVFNEKVIKK